MRRFKEGLRTFRPRNGGDLALQPQGRKELFATLSIVVS